MMSLAHIPLGTSARDPEEKCPHHLALRISRLSILLCPFPAKASIVTQNEKLLPPLTNCHLLTVVAAPTEAAAVLVVESADSGIFEAEAVSVRSVPISPLEAQVRRLTALPPFRLCRTVWMVQVAHIL